MDFSFNLYFTVTFANVADDHDQPGTSQERDIAHQNQTIEDNPEPDTENCCKQFEKLFLGEPSRFGNSQYKQFTKTHAHI